MTTAIPPEPPPRNPYRALQALPEGVWRWSVVCSSGTTEARLGQLPQWYQALQAGRLPDAHLDWGDAAALTGFRQAIGELDLPALAQGRSAVATHVLQSLMWHLDGLIDRPATQDRAQAIAAQLAAFRETWRVQKQGWEQALALLPDLGQARQWRWDDLSGRLTQREWTQALGIGRWLAQLPALQRFIDQVGRRNPAKDTPLPAPGHATGRTERTTTQDDATERQPPPGRLDGVRHSRDIARMTGADSAMLHHPTLRRWWKARFAEAQLLTYDDRLPLPQRGPQAPQDTPLAPTQARRQQGPMIACLDTSGSMRGAPENVAKACVLQTLRTASAQRRDARLLAFGGQGELLDRALSLDAQGLQTLLETLAQGFDGGTDVQTPIERAIAHVQSAQWRDADILIVSDGEFGITRSGLQSLRHAKARLGLRVHGILIGDRETIGLLEVCDALHWVRDWRRYEEAARTHADHFSPVHSRSLTALYFPNAIRRP
jgi:uncharacterized protein with von Willebrand factor type A (vWA) domain